MKHFFIKESSFQITYDLFEKLKIDLYDIAGIFYNTEQKYQQINDKLENTIINQGRTYDKRFIVDFMLSYYFHNNLEKLLRKNQSHKDLILILKLSSELPITIASRHLPFEQLKGNLELLLHRFNWNSESVETKFNLWKFAKNINYEITLIITMLNLNFIEKNLFPNGIDDKFLPLKSEYEQHLEERRKKLIEASNNISDCHCCC